MLLQYTIGKSRIQKANGKKEDGLLMKIIKGNETDLVWLDWTYFIWNLSIVYYDNNSMIIKSPASAGL